MDPRIKTGFFLAALTAILLLLGQYFGGNQGLIIMLLISVLLNFGTYFFSDKMVLKMYKANEVTAKSHPLLYGIVEKLAVRAKIPMPKVYVIPSSNPNAFATGRNPEHAAVAATDGIMDLLSKNELEAVMAHELSHIKHRDILISTIAATVAGVISYIAFIARFGAIFGGFGRDNDSGNIISLLVAAILAPIIALILQMAISRSREYMADRGSAKLLNSGESLASALEKLEVGGRRRPMRMGNQGTAHLFISNPFSGRRGMLQLFSTHPSTASRVEKLRRMKW